VTALNDVPLDWRELIAEIFIEAPSARASEFQPGFTAIPGREDDAATFIGQRSEHLSETRWGDAL
jgi:hypothetical protein